MTKTRFGISAGLTASLCYFAGISSLLVVALIMGVVLYFEQDENLRFNVLQAFALVVFVSIITQITYAINLPFNVERWIRDVLDIIKILLLLYGGVKAKDNHKVKLPVVGDWLDKNLIEL